MTPFEQLDFLNAARPIEQDAGALRHLLAQHDWLTREQAAAALSWEVRRVRAAAEHLGADIVRGQQGYKLTRNLTRDDLAAVQQAADAAISQAKKQEAYGLALLHRIHALVG